MNPKKPTFLFLLFFVPLVGSAKGALIGYEFFQGGYSNGASIRGTFTADDLDKNGQIVSFDGEVSSFSLTFSGNLFVPAFSTVDIAELGGFVWDLGDPVLGDGTGGAIEGILVTSRGSGVTYSVPPGPVAFPPAGNLSGPNGSDSTSDFIRVTPKARVPSGGSSASFLALSWAAACLLKKKLRR